MRREEMARLARLASEFAASHEIKLGFATTRKVCPFPPDAIVHCASPVMSAIAIVAERSNVAAGIMMLLIFLFEMREALLCGFIF